MEKIIVKCDPDLEDLIPGYINNRKKDIVSIQGCLEVNDLDKIRTIGHSMKGSGGGYGFDAITVIGDRLEVAALASNTTEMSQALLALEDFILRVEVVYS